MELEILQRFFSTKPALDSLNFSFYNIIVIIPINSLCLGASGLNSKGFIRKTKQREVILSVLRSTKTHPTADWIYQEVRKQMPNISLGTIYRNLKTLTEMGEIQELSYGSTYSRFDGNVHEHYHFVCEGCGRVMDVEIELSQEINQKVAEALGVSVNKHRLEFYGMCQDCAHANQQKDSMVN